MKKLSSFSILYFALVIGCSGQNPLRNEENINNPNINSNTSAICQNGLDCCDGDELICSGNADDPGMCQCDRSWVCDQLVNPQKCQQNPAVTPDGKGGWSCEVVETTERCVKSGSDQVTGKGGWLCVTNNNSVECTRSVKTPDGSGNWNCIYAEGTKVCKKTTNSSSTTPTNNSTNKDGGTPSSKLNDQGTVTPTPTPGGGTWSCTTTSETGTVCKKDQDALPPGGTGQWSCTWTETKVICTGSSETKPGGGEWTCVPTGEGTTWTCTKTRTTTDTPPPAGTGTWTCVENPSEGGMICTQPPSKPNPGSECLPNQKRWCDGIETCGFGIVECDSATGKWKRTTKNGKTILDCHEAPDGRRPNTECACHFTWWNEDCCETPDCILPEGTNGQICPASPGEQCDYCNPENSECTSGKKCYLSQQTGENFCAIDCSTTKQCPTGTKCTISPKGFLCMPTAGTCFQQ